MKESQAVIQFSGSLRDWFAGKVMEGILARGVEKNKGGAIPEFAYLMADAMLKERGKE